jgi:ABC-type transport system involved in multi-copper enzyme maturation permease subunit
MKLRRPRLGLPLLARELAEQSSHARHYALRCLCALLMFGVCFVALQQTLTADQLSGQMLLGQGQVVVDSLLQVQVFVIVLFLPAITCGAIAGEKERNTLAVLLTTRLGPLTIVLEKLASRLVVVFVLLLISLPLLALSYALGGVGLADLLTRVRGLVELSLLVASLSLMCSAWCGTTVSAFFMSYFVAGMMMLVSAFVLGYAVFFRVGHPGPALVQELLWIAPVVFIWVATRALIPRAFVTPRNFILAFFRGLDGIYTKMNVLVGDVVLVREKALLPDVRPIAWRETAKKSLGTVRYLVRVVVAIELPTVFLLAIASESPTAMGTGYGIGSYLWFFVWVVSAALIAVSAASIISGERTRQTLSVLLSTPLDGDEIVRQLFAGVRRLITVLWIPFGTIAVYQYWFYFGAYRIGEGSVFERLVCSLCEITIYPFLIGWMTFYLGSRVRSSMWAVLASLFAILAVILLPVAVAHLAAWLGAPVNVPPTLAQCSPAAIVVINEGRGATLRYTLANFTIFGAIAFLIRSHCLRNADVLLGRSKSPYGHRSTSEPSLRAFTLPRGIRGRHETAPVASEAG